MKEYKNKPKIAFLHYTYPPIVGGVENVIYSHVQLFAQYGYPTSVFVSEGENNNPRIRLKYLPTLASLAKVDHALAESIIESKEFPKKFYEISEKIYHFLVSERNNFDVLIAHNIFSLILNPCIAHAVVKFHKEYPLKKIIAWTHDIVLDDRETNPKKSHFPNPQLDNLINTPITGIHYVVISKFLKKTLTDIIGFPKQSVNVIHNGIYINNFLNLHPLTIQIIKKHSLYDADCILLFPSKIMPHKNIELCLTAVAALAHKGIKTKLIISAKNFPHGIPSGYLERTAQLIHNLKIENSVIFISDELSQQTPDNIVQVIRNFYQLSDIVLYPSAYENFGLPLLEAGITKTPIIISDLEVFDEVSNNLVFKIEMKKTSGAQLADHVQKILQENRPSLFRLIKQEYNMEHIFDQQIVPFIDNLTK